MIHLPSWQGRGGVTPLANLACLSWLPARLEAVSDALAAWESVGIRPLALHRMLVQRGEARAPAEILSAGAGAYALDFMLSRHMKGQLRVVASEV